jgi:hypothetical protein
VYVAAVVDGFDTYGLAAEEVVSHVCGLMMFHLFSIIGLAGFLSASHDDIMFIKFHFCLQPFTIS